MKSTRPRIPKAPIYNPYDKFSQNDFDAWIGDITGSLRKVLRHEEPEPEPQEDKWYHRIGDEEPLSTNGFGGHETDSELGGEEESDDPFAETRVKRVKGKARDPREGPGLTAGTMTEPIELVSDDEDSGEEDKEVEAGFEGDDGEEYEQDASDSDDVEEGDDHQSVRVGHSNSSSLSPSRRRHDNFREEDDEDVEDYDEDQVSNQIAPEEVWEEEVTPESDTVNVEVLFHSSLPLKQKLPSRSNSPEGNDRNHELEDEDQPTTENTAFPLDIEQDDLTSSQPLSLPDVWEGPQTYAEDYYSGGDVVHADDFPASADFLTEHDDFERATDPGFFLTPGLLTPNGDNAVSPALSDQEKAAIQSSSGHEIPTELLNDIDDGNVEQFNENSDSPLPGSSPMLTYPELDDEQNQSVYDQPSPVIILSDEEEGENMFIVHEERSSPPPEYEMDVEHDGALEDGHQDHLFPGMDSDVQDDEIFLPLGTSDLDIVDEVEVETDRKSSDDVEPELSLEVDMLPSTKESDLSPPQEFQDQDHASSVEETSNANLKSPEETVSGALEEPSITEPMDEPPVEVVSQVEAQSAAAISSDPIDSATELRESSQDKVSAIDEVSLETTQKSGDTSLSPKSLPIDIESFATMQDTQPGRLKAPGHSKEVDHGDDYSFVPLVPEEDELNEDGEVELDIETVPGANIFTHIHEVEEIMTEGRSATEPESSEALEHMVVQDASAPDEHTREDDNVRVIPSSAEALDTDVHEDVAQEAVDAFSSNVHIAQHGLLQSSDAAERLDLEASDVYGDSALHSDNKRPSSFNVQVPPPADYASDTPLVVDAQLQLVQDARSSPSPPSGEVVSDVVVEAERVTVPAAPDIDALGHDIKARSTSPVQLSHTELPTVTTNGINSTGSREYHDEVSVTQDNAKIDIPEAQSFDAMVTNTQPVTSPAEPFTSNKNEAVMQLSTHAVDAQSNHMPDVFIPELLARSSVPVLHADPYPASLSTPIDDIEGATDEEVDEIDQDSIISNEISTSSSSMTEEKPNSDKPPIHPDNEESDDETGEDLDMELQYPDDENTAQPLNSGTTASAADELDSDAEGDIDPDFVVGDNAIAPSQMPTLTDPHVNIEAILAEHASASSPESVDNESRHAVPVLSHPSDDNHPAPEINRIATNKNDEDAKPNVVDSQSVLALSDIVSAPDFQIEKPDNEKPEKENEIDDDQDVDNLEVLAPAVRKEIESPHRDDPPSIPSVPEVGSTQSSSTNDTGVPRRTKRKRKIPVTIQNGYNASTVLPTSKSKGKKRASPQDISDTASTSSASAAVRILTGSRASSVVSTLTRDGSAPTNPSPTPLRAQEASSTGAQLPAPPLQPPPPPQLMFHNHSKKKPAPHRPALTLQTEIPKTLSRASSLPQPFASSSSQQRSPEEDSSHSRSGTPAPDQSHIIRREPSTNSPVTRSHCRYHKISLAEEEDGAHIHFLVPGCSLVDRKLIQEEEIVDHGDATYEDSLRKVADIETLGINEYVLGVIRLLVGPDKEHEVYFLPRPGEERARKLIHRARRSRLGRSSFGSSAGLGSPRGSTSNLNGNVFSPSSSSLAPVSVAGSSSTNRSKKQRRPRRHDRERDGDSSLWSEAYSTESGNEESDGTDENVSKAKRPKLVHTEEDGVITNQDSLGIWSRNRVSDPIHESASAVTATRTKAKRKRPLDSSAIAYKPGQDAGDTSTDEEDIPKPKKRKAAIKRASTTNEPKSRPKKTKSVPFGLPN
ncbi:hypothetical protein C8R42DRAFT_449806 [Lentinula raphanica]|nr:hypothetical protein C8R42DRAFT_449806 [Lentinula raphanica]